MPQLIPWHYAKRKRDGCDNHLVSFAVRTGLEPATPGVTGRYSNQLNYRTILFSLMRFSQTRLQRYAKNPILQIFLEENGIFLQIFTKKFRL